MALPYYIRNSSEFKLLKPNEKIILYVIYDSDENRFNITQISRLTNIDRSNTAKYIKSLAEKDLLDMCLFGRIIEVLKK